MKQTNFKDLWDVFVNDFIRSPNSGVIHKAYCENRLILSDTAWKAVYLRYQKILQYFKANYYANSNQSHISRHIRSAIMTYAMIDIKPITIENVSTSESIYLRLVNECVAFYFGLHSLLIEYDDSAIEKAITNYSSVFFKLPSSVPQGYSVQPKSDETSYVASVCKDLYFSQIFRNYNILTMADKYNLLETFCCTLKLKDE